MGPICSVLRGPESSIPATAVLGADIRHYASFSPVGLQADELVGCLTSTLKMGADPFTRIRVPGSVTGCRWSGVSEAARRLSRSGGLPCLWGVAEEITRYCIQLWTPPAYARFREPLSALAIDTRARPAECKGKVFTLHYRLRMRLRGFHDHRGINPATVPARRSAVRKSSGN